MTELIAIVREARRLRHLLWLLHAVMAAGAIAVTARVIGGVAAAERGRFFASWLGVTVASLAAAALASRTRARIGELAVLAQRVAGASARRSASS